MISGGAIREVWRIEWQVRKAILRRFEIRTIEHLTERCGDLLRYLAFDHDRLLIASEDSNKSRWSEHELWADLQNLVSDWPGFGVHKVVPLQAHVRQRRQQVAIVIYGMLKQFAALESFSGLQGTPKVEQAISSFERGMRDYHDAYTWQKDVESRIAKIRLGACSRA